MNYSPQIGPNADPDDGLRYWVQWLYTKDSRVLELPPTYLDSRVKMGLTTPDNNRREAEQDDHGEGYPQAMDGPHIYTTLTIPEGLFVLSLYDFNKDVHDWTGNRFRDYRLSVRAHFDPSPNEASSLDESSGLDDISGFGAQPELARGRIRDFWGGVWKRFQVRGPVDLTVEVNRNNSHNTILPAVMLDLVDETRPHILGRWISGKQSKRSRKKRGWHWRRILPVSMRHLRSRRLLTICSTLWPRFS